MTRVVTTILATLTSQVASAGLAVATTTSTFQDRATVTSKLESASSVFSTRKDSAVNIVWLDFMETPSIKCVEVIY